jgi:enolase
VDRTAATRRVLVHGDVSPKNVLVGGAQPVLLDAECAWFGDPAFDLAFCLNHFLLKLAHRPAGSMALLACFERFLSAYLPHVHWERVDAIQDRTAALLPGLALARVDGKSPVEYLSEPRRHVVREASLRLLHDPRPPSTSWPSVGPWIAPHDHHPRLRPPHLGLAWPTHHRSGSGDRRRRHRPWHRAGRRLAGQPRSRGKARWRQPPGRPRRPGRNPRDRRRDRTHAGWPGRDGPGRHRRGAGGSGRNAHAIAPWGNALIATSLAVLHAAAAQARLPLWRYLAGDQPVRLPLPQIQIFGGGAHAGRRVDVQDFMVIATGARSFGQALEMTAEVYRCAGERMARRGPLAGVADEGGWWPSFEHNEEALDVLVAAIEDAGFVPGEQVAIALDIAASEFGKAGRYRLALEDRELDSDALCERLVRWVERYPIVSIEDPLAEDDEAGLVAFTRAVGHRVQVVGDDYLVTNASRVQHAAEVGACNCVLVKPNQAGTVTETVAALHAARQAGYASIVSARSGETEDVAIVHLATGWNAGQLKVGSFARSERMAKWNEGIRLEDATPAPAGFWARAALARGGKR